MQRPAEHLPAKGTSAVAKPWKSPSFMGYICTNMSSTGPTPEPGEAWGVNGTSHYWYIWEAW